jgi:hypothetical protein
VKKKTVNEPDVTVNINNSSDAKTSSLERT